MNLSDYQNQAITTKIYADEVAFSYVALGLVGEAAELYEKYVEFADTGDRSNIDLLAKEVGDVMWYIAAWAEENGCELDAIEPLATSIDPLIGSRDLMFNIIIQAGAVAELTKKALRDDYGPIKHGIFPPAKLAKANIAIANLVINLRLLCRRLILDFDKILQDNLDKLRSRAERGKIGGSGDLR